MIDYDYSFFVNYNWRVFSDSAAILISAPSSSQSLFPNAAVQHERATRTYNKKPSYLEHIHSMKTAAAAAAAVAAAGIGGGGASPGAAVSAASDFWGSAVVSVASEGGLGVSGRLIPPPPPPPHTGLPFGPHGGTSGATSGVVGAGLLRCVEKKYAII